MQIPLEHLQVFVARAKLHFGDAVALFEQAADRLMADVVKVEVFKAGGRDRDSDACADRICLVREDELTTTRLALDDVPRGAQQRGDLVTLLAWVFPLADQDRAVLLVDVVPPQAARLANAEGTGQLERQDVLIRDAGVREVIDDRADLVVADTPVTHVGFSDDAVGPHEARRTFVGHHVGPCFPQRLRGRQDGAEVDDVLLASAGQDVPLAADPIDQNFGRQLVEALVAKVSGRTANDDGLVVRDRLADLRHALEVFLDGVGHGGFVYRELAFVHLVFGVTRPAFRQGLRLEGLRNCGVALLADQDSVAVATLLNNGHRYTPWYSANVRWRVALP